MKKLKLSTILLEAQKNEQNFDQAQNPSLGNQGQEPPSSASEETPTQINVSNQSKSALADIIGSTISDISYEKIGTNGGKLSIKTSNSHIPMIISWAGPKVTVSKQNGTVVMLSGDG